MDDPKLLILLPLPLKSWAYKYVSKPGFYKSLFFPSTLRGPASHPLGTLCTFQMGRGYGGQGLSAGAQDHWFLSRNFTSQETYSSVYRHWIQMLLVSGKQNPRMLLNILQWVSKNYLPQMLTVVRQCSRGRLSGFQLTICVVSGKLIIFLLIVLITKMTVTTWSVVRMKYIKKRLSQVCAACP